MVVRRSFPRMRSVAPGSPGAQPQRVQCGTRPHKLPDAFDALFSKTVTAVRKMGGKVGGAGVAALGKRVRVARFCTKHTRRHSRNVLAQC